MYTVVALGLPPLMIDTPWLLGPKVPRCGMPGEHVHLHNAPGCCVLLRGKRHVYCYEASSMCFAMRQWKL